MYSYDDFGWKSDAEIPGRTTEVAPPVHGAKIIGQPYPNWTGVEWVLASYVEPSVIHAPIPVNTRLTRLAWLNRLGPELEAIYILAQTNISVQIYRDKVLAADCIDRADPLTIKGINDMVTAGIYTEERGTEILTSPVTDKEAYTG